MFIPSSWPSSITGFLRHADIFGVGRAPSLPIGRRKIFWLQLRRDLGIDLCWLISFVFVVPRLCGKARPARLVRGGLR